MNVGGSSRHSQKDRPVLHHDDCCPSSGDENAASPRKRMKIDYHSTSSGCGSVSIQGILGFLSGRKEERKGGRIHLLTICLFVCFVGTI